MRKINKVKAFKQPDSSIKKFGNIIWYTNVDHKKRHEPLFLYQLYDKTNFNKYENFEAVNVNNTKNIPVDFEGIMGVPISWIDKYCPEQFDIIGLGISNLGLKSGVKPYKKEHRYYRRNIQKRGCVDGDLYLLDKNGHPSVLYARVLIAYTKDWIEKHHHSFETRV